MVLANRNRIALAAASRASVEQTLATCTPYLNRGTWLSPRNRYAKEIVKVIKNEEAAGVAPARRQLSQYIAASSLLHCADGWSYLGRAVHALLAGDARASLHLAYYAELRAAMSMMACEGVGILDTQHAIIDGPNSASLLPSKSTTHAFAWDCLSDWAQNPSSATLFASVVRPRSISLDDWLTPEGGGSAVAAQARDWFKQWGMDLAVFADDRSARNNVSYRPGGISGLLVPDVAAAVAFVSETWACLQPSTAGSFSVLDLYILRLTLERLFLARRGHSSRRAPTQFERFVRNVVSYQNLDQAASDELRRFFTRAEQPNDPALFRFSSLPPSTPRVSHLAVISRAILLLRMAAGSTSWLFDNAGVARTSIAFWRDGFGFSKGAWSVSGPPTDLVDLWADVDVSLRDANNFLAAPPASQSFRDFGLTAGQAFASLGGFERVALWSLAAA